MEIVLGVSMTPTTVRMVLVEGDKADGVTVDHDVFDITSVDGSATSSSSDHVIAAVLGTQESAGVSGHRLISTGVTWSDRANAAELRDALAARRIEDVLLVSELHAAGALAQAVGQAVGYDKTALMLIDRDTATLSVVESSDGSIVKVDSRSLHSDDAMAVITGMVTGLQTHPFRPEGMFVVGSGVDVTAVKEHLEHLVSMPVSAPEEPELALARGAALASANAPRFDASTVGLAYSQDPDGTTAGNAYAVGLAAADTQLAAAYDPAGVEEPELVADEADDRQDQRKPFLLVGSSLTGIFVVGVVALVISLAVSIRPTVDTRPSPGGENAIQPSAVAPPPAVQDAQPGGPPPPAETIKEPVPVVQQQQSPRTVVVEAPAPQAPAPAPAAPAPPPAAPPADLPAAPPAPVYLPPAPVYAPPPIYMPPPIIAPPQLPPWRPPWRPPPEKPPWTPPSDSPWTPPSQPPSQKPEQPPSEIPQQQQQPQQQGPLWPPSGSGGFGGSGSGGSPGSGSGGSGGSGSGGSSGSNGGSGRTPMCSSASTGCY